MRSHFHRIVHVGCAERNLVRVGVEHVGVGTFLADQLVGNCYLWVAHLHERCRRHDLDELGRHYAWGLVRRVQWRLRFCQQHALVRIRVCRRASTPAREKNVEVTRESKRERQK
eukprot:4571908-Pleurochrysis_carterae.AAC.2